MSAPGNPARSRIELLPWHAAARERLEAAIAGGRLPHALLLQGPVGVGKEQFAAALAAALVCTGRGERLEACGACAECMLTRAGSHPDLHWLQRPEDRKTIAVDQVRELAERLAMTSMRRGPRVAIVTPALTSFIKFTAITESAIAYRPRFFSALCFTRCTNAVSGISFSSDIDFRVTGFANALSVSVG